LAFFLSEKLDPENADEPHIDTLYKSLLFWRGSVITEVTKNFQPPVKTLVPNSCLKLNSILYKSQNREANDGSVHCADVEGIDVKSGSANSFGCRTLGKILAISPSPERFELLSSNTSQIWGHLDEHQLLTLHLSSCNWKAMSKKHYYYYKQKMKMAKFSLQFETPSIRRVFPVGNSKSIFI